MLPKPRPRALTRTDRKRGEDKLYRESRQIALARDQRHCRICGSHTLLETHHIKARSGFGPKRVTEKHDARNLLTVCGGANGCHELITTKVIKLLVGPDGADGPVEVLRWHDASGGYVTVRSAA